MERSSIPSEDGDGSIGERALPSLVLPLASPVPTSNMQSPDNPAPKDYSVHPVRPDKIDEVFQKVQTFADGDVHTQHSPNRPEMKGVLYWSFKITEMNAHVLRETLGPDVCAQFGLVWKQIYY